MASTPMAVDGDAMSTADRLCVRHLSHPPPRNIYPRGAATPPLSIARSCAAGSNRRRRYTFDAEKVEQTRAAKAWLRECAPRRRSLERAAAAR